MAKKSTKRANSVDKHVGTRLRTKRTELRLTQTEIGEAMGITFQQVQKYEKGTNRLSAGRLWDIAKFLQVPIQYFFEGLR
jgi:transcriptional regulator with XRE-family HTH domain